VRATADKNPKQTQNPNVQNIKQINFIWR